MERDDTSARPDPVGVLVVDDDDEIRELLGELLALEGYPVRTAINGAAALEVLRDRQRGLPRLIVLDLMMPVMDGWTMRAELLADPELALIPIVVLSGAADLQVGKRGDLHAAAIMTKPVKWPDLLAMVQSHG